MFFTAFQLIHLLQYHPLVQRSPSQLASLIGLGSFWKATGSPALSYVLLRIPNLGSVT